MGKRKALKVKSSAGNIKVSNKWTVIVTVLAFVLSVIFTIITDSAEKLPNFVAITVLFVIVLLSIMFDMLGMAVSTATEEPFHAMAAKRIPQAKVAIKIIRASQQLSSLFNDVIGDICGIISGSAGAAITVRVVVNQGTTEELITSIIISTLISVATIGGKANGKKLAMKKNKEIVMLVGGVLNFFKFGKNK